MRRFSKVLTLALAGILLPSFLFAYQSPGTPTGFVNDFSHALSSDQKQALEQKLSQFSQSAGDEITVVTIPTLSGDTIENFAVELFKEWGIGKKGKDNGVLILVVTEDHEMRIEVGYGLEGDLTDAKSSQIMNRIMKPRFQANDFSGGLNSAVDAIISVLGGGSLPENTENNPFGEQSAFSIFFFGYIFITYLGSVLARSKSWWAGGVIGGIIAILLGFFLGFFYTGIIALVFLIPLGLLFDFIVSRAYTKGKQTGLFPWWIGGGGGGRGFGGGGGFGGFGAGSSGGGGASGRW